MSDLAQLTLNRPVDPRMPVSVQIGPDGSIGIQVGSTVNILQHRPFTCGDDDGLAFGPVRHLGERMPHVTTVQLSDRMH